MSTSTKLSIQVSDYPLAGLQRFTPEELEAIAASLTVSTPEGTRLVKFGPNPPSDRNTPWQQTLDDEITPIGGVKYFTNGQWAYPPGSQFSGPIGPQGPVGPQGETGPQGPQQTAESIKEILEDETLPVAVLQPDWIELQDMTGVTIPANSLGQKAGIPYYGNVALSDGKRRFYTGGASPTALTLATIPIAASDMYSNKRFWLDMDIGIVQGGTVGSFQTALIMDFLTGSLDDTSTGAFIDTGLAKYLRIRYNGLIAVTADGPNLIPFYEDASNGAGLTFTQQASDGGALTTSIFDSGLAGFSSAGSGNVPNVANSLVFKLCFGPSSTITSALIRGHVGLYPL
jgi:hypothetical protein